MGHDPEEEHRRKVHFWAQVAALAAVAAVVVAVFAFGDQYPDTRTVRQFQNWYWNTAPQDPVAAWNRVDEGLQEEWANRPGSDQILFDEDYLPLMSSLEEVAVSTSRVTEGWADVQLRFTYESGIVEEREVAYQHLCPFLTRLWLVDCHHSDVMLTNSERLD